MILTVVAVLACAAMGAAVSRRVFRRSRDIAAPATPASIVAEPAVPEVSVLDITPSFFLLGEPPEAQQVIVEDAQPMRISAVEYLTGSGKVAARQEVRLTGSRIEHTIDDSFIRAVLRLEHNPWDGSATLQLRFQAHRAQLDKKVVFALYCIPEIKLGNEGRMTEVRRLLDFRKVPDSLTSHSIQ